MQPYVDILEPGNVASHAAAIMFSSLDAQIDDSHIGKSTILASLGKENGEVEKRALIVRYQEF